MLVIYRGWHFAWLMVHFLLFRSSSQPSSLDGASAAGSVDIVDYLSWHGSVRLSNGVIEVVVVPAIGRIMSLRFVDGPNVLWTDPTLGGKWGNGTDMKEWINFGGDKIWPAPDGEWKNWTGSPIWMPPSGFDGLPAAASIPPDRPLTVVLKFPTDPHYGVQLTRVISLHPSKGDLTVHSSVMRVLAGASPKFSLWTITQFTSPVAVYMPQPSEQALHDMGKAGYTMFGQARAMEFDDMLALVRDPRQPYKVRSDKDFLVWQGPESVCHVSSLYHPNVKANDVFPDQSSHVQMYSNPDPKPYVELETMGPMRSVELGRTMRSVTTYQLRRLSPRVAPPATVGH
eukprot:g54039.t1